MSIKAFPLNQQIRALYDPVTSIDRIYELCILSKMYYTPDYA